MSGVCVSTFGASTLVFRKLRLMPARSPLTAALCSGVIDTYDTSLACTAVKQHDISTTQRNEAQADAMGMATCAAATCGRNWETCHGLCGPLGPTQFYSYVVFVFVWSATLLKFRFGKETNHETNDRQERTNDDLPGRYVLLIVERGESRRA